MFWILPRFKRDVFLRPKLKLRPAMLLDGRGHAHDATWSRARVEWALALYAIDIAIIFALGRIALKVVPGQSTGLIMEMHSFKMPINDCSPSQRIWLENCRCNICSQFCNCPNRGRSCFQTAFFCVVTCMIVEDLLARIMEQEQDRASGCFVV